MDQDSQSISFLYDFLYVDRPRLSSYSAQIFNAGVLTSTKETTSLSEAQRDEIKGNAGVVAGAISGSESFSEGLEKQFDASWSLPLNVIDRLDELGFLGRSLNLSPTGEIVLIKGEIALLDIKMLKEMWDPTAKFMLSQEKQTHATKSSLNAARDQFQTLGGMLKQLPSTVQTYMESQGGELVWSSLSPDSLTINPEDISLQYGSYLRGEWNMIGVIDARPDIENSVHSFSIPSELFNGVMGMMNAIRGIAGRPDSAYGVTPLVIFRSIQRPK